VRCNVCPEQAELELQGDSLQGR